MHNVAASITAESNIYLELTAAFFGIILSLYLFFNRKNSLRQFRILVYLVTLSDILDIANIYIVKVSSLPEMLKRLSSTLNYYCFVLISYSLFCYIIAYMKPSDDIRVLKRTVIVSLILCTGTLAINMFFSTDTFTPVRNSIRVIGGFVIPIFIVTLSFYLMSVHHDDFTVTEFRTILIAYVISIAGSIIQIFTGASFAISYFPAIIAVYILYFTLETPDYRTMAELIKEYTDAEKEADESSRQKNDLFAGMTHEIKKPLNTIIGMDKLIIMESNEPEVKDLADSILEKGENVLTVVNSVLEDARAEKESKS